MTSGSSTPGANGRCAPSAQKRSTAAANSATYRPSVETDQTEWGGGSRRVTCSRSLPEQLAIERDGLIARRRPRELALGDLASGEAVVRQAREVRQRPAD